MRRLLPAPTRADRGLVLLVAALCACVTVAAAGTGWWLRSSADRMSEAVFDAAGPEARQLQVTYGRVTDPRLPATAAEELVAALPDTARSAFGRPRHTVVTPSMAPKVLPSQPSAPAFLVVAGFPEVDGLVDVVEGRMPRPGSRLRTLPGPIGRAYNPFSDAGYVPPTPARARVVEVVLETSAARELRMPVGSWVQVPSSTLTTERTPSAVLLVVGTVRPAAAAPTALDDADSARSPLISRTPEFNVVRATALAADEETVLGASWETEPELRFTFDLLGNPGAGEARALVEDARRLTLQTWPPVVQAEGFTAGTGVGPLAEQVLTELNTSDGVLVLVVTALGAAALCVLLAAAVVLAGRRRDVTTVVLARGASARWLVGHRGGEALLLTVPGAVAALTAVWLADGSLHLADVAVVAASAGTCWVLVTAAHVAPRSSGAGRLQLVARDAAQLVVVGLAAGTTALVLRDDTLTADDPLLVATPVLLGAAASVLLARVLHAGLAALGGTVRGTRLMTPVVALAEAAQLARQVVLASAALVLAASSGWLTLAAGDALRTGAEHTGWEQVGADAAVLTDGFHDDTVERLADVPGVEEVAPVSTTPSASISTRTGVEGVVLVAADPARLRTVGEARLRDLALPAAPPGELTGVASTDLALEGDGTTLLYAQTRIPVRVVDRVDRIPGVTDEPFLLVDIGELTAIVERRLDSYSAVLMAGDPEPASVREVAQSVDPLAVVTTRAAVADDVLESPATRRTLTVLAVATGATALLAALAVLLLVGLGAPTRRRTGGVLGALGADRRQVGRVHLVALVPVVVAACVTATGCGLLLAGIVGHGLDLAGLTATRGQLPVRPTATSALAASGALTALVLAAGLLARRSNRARDIIDPLDEEHG